MHNSDDAHLAFPSNFDDLIKAIQDAKKKHGPKLMYRGQKNVEWEINSSFSRGFQKHKDTWEFIRNPITRNEEKAYFIAIQSFMNYFSSIKPTEELNEKVRGKGCPYFEYARTHQQNFRKAKIQGIQELNLPGTPLIDFTFDELIGLFFANFDINYDTPGLQPELKAPRNSDAALYVVDYQAFDMYDSFLKIFLRYKLADIENRAFREPCIIHPSSQIDDRNDMKPKRQQAFYVVHIDSRFSIDEFLCMREGILRKQLYTKIIVPKALFEECREFLYNRNYTLDYLFPSEIQYRAERIRRIFEQKMEAFSKNLLKK
jgi:hypothetical protein